MVFFLVQDDCIYKENKSLKQSVYYLVKLKKLFIVFLVLLKDSNNVLIRLNIFYRTIENIFEFFILL